MKDYMLTHTFKYEELRDKYFKATKEMIPDDIKEMSNIMDVRS